MVIDFDLRIANLIASSTLGHCVLGAPWYMQLFLYEGEASI